MRPVDINQSIEVDNLLNLSLAFIISSTMFPGSSQNKSP